MDKSNLMSILKKIKLYFYTIRYLKISQLYFQLLYRLEKKVLKSPFNHERRTTPKVYGLRLQPSIASNILYEDGTFIFLNKKKKFEGKIDWDFQGHGKLWAYNLNYFEFLNQKDIKSKTAVDLINDYCKAFEHHREGSEPYPISVRGINWLKFFSYRGVNEPLFDRVLFLYYQYLASHPEYHLLGNHLLENGFSLMFASYRYREESFYTKAKKILESQLDEQVLSDGAHFELSPMYHQTILFRLLDTINLVKNNDWKNHSLLPFLSEKATAMLAWLKAITFSNGDIPMVNDSAYGIAPESAELDTYADQLGIHAQPPILSDSGYQMVRHGNFELFIDTGNIGPDYIPGHAHSDTFNFVLYVNGKPLIVDTGTSTYEAGSRRIEERSTKSHNTVIVGNHEQSEVWASFRVGRRAKILYRENKEGKISASHDGYKFMGIVHNRSWQSKDGEILIVDEITGSMNDINAIAFIHFHSDIDVRIDKQTLLTDSLRINFSRQENLKLEDYNLAAGFNKTIKSKVLKIEFTNRLVTTLTFV
jgi:uncharacterized heparinase superfamily protein